MRWLILLLLLGGHLVSHAEVVLDGSLGTALEIDLFRDRYEIATEYGQQRGSNLFHSFSTLNVERDTTASFASNASITNIIGRITNGEISQIDGQLQTDANLFLLNPAGFFFGRNATLDIGGTFALSSADYLRFSDNTIFHAALASTSTLSVAEPSAFGFVSNQPAPLYLQGAVLDLDRSGAGDAILVGGDITLDSAPNLRGGVYLFTYGGDIHITSAASRGEVPLDPEQPTSLSHYGNITIKDQSWLNTTSTEQDAGSIHLRAYDLAINDAALESGSRVGIGGTVNLAATGQLDLSNDASISVVGTEGSHKIVLQGDNVSVLSGSQISNQTYQGQGGDISITANNNLIINGISTTKTEPTPSSVQTIHSGFGGSAGDINLSAKNITLSNQAEVFSQEKEIGGVGTIRVNAEQLQVSNNVDVFTDTMSEGNNAHIEINAQQVDVSQNSQIKTTSVDDTAGHLYINAQQSINLNDSADVSTRNGALTVNTTNLSLNNQSILVSSGEVNVNATNTVALNQNSILNTKGGRHTLQLNAMQVWLSDDSELSSDADLWLTAQQLQLQNGSDLFASQLNLTVSLLNADASKITGDINFSGQDVTLNQVELGGGEYDLRFNLSGKLILQTSYLEASNLSIQAQNLQFDNSTLNIKQNLYLSSLQDLTMSDSEVSTTTFSTNTGRLLWYNTPLEVLDVMGLTAQQVVLSNSKWAINKTFDANVLGIWDMQSGHLDSAEALHINAVQLNWRNSFVFSQTLDVLSNTLTWQQIEVGGTHIAFSAPQQMQLMDIEVSADQTLSLTGGTIELDASELGLSKNTAGGRLDIVAQSLMLHNGSSIGAQGNKPIQIEAQRLDMREQSTIATRTDSAQSGGDITLQVAEINLDNATISTDSNGSGSGGTLSVQTDSLTLSSNSELQASTFAQGSGGAIEINATQQVALNNSDIFANVVNASGNGGLIRINAPQISLVDNSRIEAGTDATGHAGQISLNSQIITLANNSLINTSSSGSGAAGAINLIASDQVHVDRASIASSALAEGAGGRVDIRTNNLEVINDGEILSATVGRGDAGGVQVQTESLLLLDGGRITVESCEVACDAETQALVGKGGIADIQVSGTALISGYSPDVPLSQANASGISSSAWGQQSGGAIHLSAQQLVIENLATIQSLARSDGAAGDIHLTLGDLHIREGGDIDASNEGTGTGSGGNVLIEASGQVNIAAGIFTGDDVPEQLRNQYVGGIYSVATNTGAGGAITLQAQQLNIYNGGVISAESTGSGAGGAITLQAELLDLNTEGSISAESSGSGAGGAITLQTELLDLNTEGSISAESSGSGAGGAITVQAQQLNIYNNSVISAASHGSGAGGSITLQAQQLDLGSKGSINAESSGTGAGGTIDLTVTQFKMSDNASVSARSTGSGDAGNLLVCVTDTLYLDTSTISTLAENAGGGNIRIDITNRALLFDSAITARAEGLARDDAGGNITITGNEYIIVDNGQILASAVGGDGGNITLTAYQFVPSGDSIVDASSELGVDGGVVINSPDSDISGSLLVLPSNFFDASDLMRGQCSLASLEDNSQFVLNPLTPLQPSPEGLQQSPLVW